MKNQIYLFILTNLFFLNFIILKPTYNMSNYSIAFMGTEQCPDSSQKVYCAHNIIILHPQTEKLEELYSGFIDPNTLKWSPEHTKLLFEKDSDLYIIEIATKKVTRVSGDGRNKTYSTWNPNGSEIAFVANDNSSTPSLFLIDTESLAERQLTKNLAINSRISFSPDGLYLLFSAKKTKINSSKQTTNLYLLDTTIGNISNLTNSDFDEGFASWDLNSKNILYLSNKSGIFQLYLMNLVDLKVKQLTFDNEYKNSPKWFFDGKSILYYAILNNVSSLYLLDTSDLELTKLATKFPFSSFDISPDTEDVTYIYKRTNEDDIQNEICIVNIHADENNCIKETIALQPFYEGPIAWSNQ